MKNRKGHSLMKSVNRMIIVVAVLSGGAFAFMTVNANFVPPRVGPPIGFGAPITDGASFHLKQGYMGAQDVFLTGLGQWVSQGPKIVIKESIGPGNTNNQVVYCDAGYKVIGCSGSRQREAGDNCPEGDCGLVGSIPVDSSGAPASYENALGCKVGIDPDGTRNEPVVHAYCMQDVSF